MVMSRSKQAVFNFKKSKLCLELKLSTLKHEVLTNGTARKQSSSIQLLQRRSGNVQLLPPIVSSITTIMQRWLWRLWTFSICRKMIYEAGGKGFKAPGWDKAVNTQQGIRQHCWRVFIDGFDSSVCANIDQILTGNCFPLVFISSTKQWLWLHPLRRKNCRFTDHLSANTQTCNKYLDTNWAGNAAAGQVVGSTFSSFEPWTFFPHMFSSCVH